MFLLPISRSPSSNIYILKLDTNELKIKNKAKHIYTNLQGTTLMVHLFLFIPRRICYRVSQPFSQAFQYLAARPQRRSSSIAHTESGVSSSYRFADGQLEIECESPIHMHQLKRPHSNYPGHIIRRKNLRGEHFAARCGCHYPISGFGYKSPEMNSHNFSSFSFFF